MSRELVLQLKLGHVAPAYFRRKYASTSSSSSRSVRVAAAEGYLARAPEAVIELTRDGLLRVDALLPRFFLPQHTGIRYT